MNLHTAAFADVIEPGLAMEELRALVARNALVPRRQFFFIQWL